MDVLSFYLTACNPRFLELENDFGMTPLAAVKEKVAMIRDKVEAKNVGSQEKDKLYRKMEKLLAVQNYLLNFDDFITEEKWDARFEIPLHVMLELSVDPNLEIFMGMTKAKEAPEVDLEGQVNFEPIAVALGPSGPSGNKD
jgi:hypothetical protein